MTKNTVQPRGAISALSPCQLSLCEHIHTHTHTHTHIHTHTHTHTYTHTHTHTYTHTHTHTYTHTHTHTHIHTHTYTQSSLLQLCFCQLMQCAQPLQHKSPYNWIRLHPVHVTLAPKENFLSLAKLWGSTRTQTGMSESSATISSKVKWRCYPLFSAPATTNQTGEAMKDHPSDRCFLLKDHSSVLHHYLCIDGPLANDHV